MEAKIIGDFFPKLITAVSACVQSVSDHCLAKGLIEGTTRRKVLESVGTENEKARILILAVSDNVSINPECFNAFMIVLENVLPSAIKGLLLKEMKAAVTSEIEHLSPPKLISSDSDTHQLQPISEPSSKGEFIHNRYHDHDQATKEPAESDSVTSAMSAISEGASSDMPNTALESLELSHSQVADAMVTLESGDDHIGTLSQNQSKTCTLHAQNEEVVEGTAILSMINLSQISTKESSTSATQVYLVESNQDVEVSCSLIDLSL
jgi:hypothetical protein